MLKNLFVVFLKSKFSWHLVLSFAKSGRPLYKDMKRRKTEENLKQHLRALCEVVGLLAPSDVLSGNIPE